MTQLTGDSFDIFKHYQQFGAMTGSCRKLEELILKGGIVHDKNPIMDWCISNVSVATNAYDEIRPVKPAKGTSKRIDGVVALVMALGMAIHAEELKPSIYEGTVKRPSGALLL